MVVLTAPYVDPNSVHVPSVGGTPPASWGTTLRGNGETLARPPGAVIARSGAQSISNEAWNTVAFTSADERDTDAYHSTVTNPSRVTIPAGLGGWYDIGGFFSFTSHSTGNRIVQLLLNGVGTVYQSIWTGAVANGQTMPMVPLQLVAGDYLEWQVFQNSGGALNLTVARAWARLVAWP